ncbi:AraC family transcriptional regulator ligand-binding domain-containing protein [Dinoroseobacter sp. S375]|uniref:helix-turn-helix transcriptional regulator n=1 Tax=Dinoroseobacter sp. S375 TaxID=3415136 RepID=UPI003C7C13D4
MKRAAPIADDGQESVPNYWLSSLKEVPHLGPGALAAALEAAGLETRVLDTPGEMVPLMQEIAVVEALARQSDDPLFALKLGLAARANTGSILSYILFASPTLRAGLDHIAEFVRLTRPRSRVEIRSEGATTEFRMGHPAPRVQRAVHYREFVLGSILNSWSAATQAPVQPQRVHVAAPIGHRARAISGALGCPVEDATGYTAIVLKSSALDLPIRSSDAHLLLHLTEYGRLILSQRRPDPTSTRERVFQYLMRRFHAGLPRLQDAAEALGLSERTLSRKLAEEGTTFRLVIDETREAMAAALLEDPSVSLTEISYLLGFSDPSSFSNAYRRWTGRPPISARAPRQKSA